MLCPTLEHCSFTEPYCGMCALSSSPKHGQRFPEVALWQCAAGAVWWNVAAILRSRAVTTRALRGRRCSSCVRGIRNGRRCGHHEFLNSQLLDTVSFYDAHESFYYVSDSVYIMEHGRFVESGAAEEVILHPKAEYTKRLISDVPKIHEPWDFSVQSQAALR